MASEQVWAEKLAADMIEYRGKLLSDEKASPSCWNGDDWGSISGIRDAEEWKSRMLGKFLLDRIAKRRANGE